MASRTPVSRSVTAPELGLLLSAFVVAMSVPLAGCHDNASDSEEVAEVSISVSLPLDSANGVARTLSAQGNVQAAAAFTDVAKIMVDITNVSVTPNRVIYRNTELTRGVDNFWSAKLPFVPRDVMLEFRSRATDVTSAELFNGVQQQTITGPNTTVTLGLKPIDHNKTLVIPRISRISVPTEFSSGGSGSITVNVEGSSGEVIRFTALPALNGGTIFPPSGQMTLAGTSGSLVFQYNAPVLNEEQTFQHLIQIENPRGTSVQSNFATLVRKVGQTVGVNTELRVTFSPIVNNLVARRVPDTATIDWRAEVTDDRPTDQEQLTYNWSFVPTTGTTSSAAFAAGTTRSNVMSNYDTSTTGIIKLSVTDADNGTTTINWALPVNQFLAQSELIVDVGNVGGVASVLAGGDHTCARLTTGGVRCWGRALEGQLGYGDVTAYGTSEDKLPYVAGSIPNIESAVQIVAGSKHSCALFSNGQMACWGYNLNGQLGYNTTDSVGDTESVASYGFVNVGGNVSRIAAGGQHTCAVLDTGNVRCWGLNTAGQLGYGSSGTDAKVGDNEAPYTVGDVNLGGALVSDVVTGNEHTCVLLRDGNVRCWGYNAYGQLGYGRSDNIGDGEIPLATNLNFNGATVRQLTAGANHTCALLSNGSVRCWGYNAYGQLGIDQLFNNNTTTSGYNNWGDAAGETPFSLQTTHGDVKLGGAVALQISAGANHTCALLDTGAVRCWGNNINGQLGQGDKLLRDTPLPPTAATTTPTYNPVRLGASVVRLASGDSHNCALLSTGRVRCWGLGTSGQLGYGNLDSVGDNEQADAAGPIALLGP